MFLIRIKITTLFAQLSRYSIVEKQNILRMNEYFLYDEMEIDTTARM